MVRTKRRRKYTWMPTLGGLGAIEGSAYGTSFFAGVVEADGPALGPTDLYVTPIVPDYTFWPDSIGGNAQTLRDLTEGQDWLLKRIVGKLHVSAGQIQRTTQDDGPATIYVGAGFFVGPADDQNVNVPAGNNSEFDPLGSQNIRQPWIWRRTWILANSQQATAFIPEIWPLNNMFAGSVQDGPHIDAKSARRIRREERLWFVINAYGTLGTDLDKGHFTHTGPVEFFLDYRILGAMRRSNNRSTFA